jgi:hypothetical protein
MKLPEILQIYLNSYSLGAGFCKKNLVKGRASMFVINSNKFNQI